MKLPQNMTEEQVLEVIEKAIKGFSGKFKFGYFDIDDIEQEARIYAMEAMEKYDESRPLENFLRVHIRNRLINLRRNKYERYEPPCLTCPFYDPQCKVSTNKCSEFINKDNCEAWVEWKQRNAAKSGLMRPLDIDSVTENEIDADTEFLNNINLSSIYKTINEKMPIDLRADFLRMLDGVYIPKHRKEKVREFILDLGVLDELKDWQTK